ncbi:hypothetical protein BP00DRAFT_243632 [Aspergillus indologenus CBS 114.80]|uniref:Secreted protein n=1 Tax=Aspergillus indologenus CBS 114.80 TaxID=1450541 RepID=A0A2V5HXH8_9EURO|nr:hypothetical protein BP00DRAFT_243632 [Aspergillus indologenus CBS 114.80]
MVLFFLLAVESCGWRCPRAVAVVGMGRKSRASISGGGNQHNYKHRHRRAIRPLETATNDRVWSREVESCWRLQVESGTDLDWPYQASLKLLGGTQ